MKKETVIESILDLNSTNVWKLTEQEIRDAWEKEKLEGNFTSSEEKLLNIIRLNFDVVHYNPGDPRERAKYENGEWAIFQHCNEKNGKHYAQNTGFSAKYAHKCTKSNTHKHKQQKHKNFRDNAEGKSRKEDCEKHHNRN